MCDACAIGGKGCNNPIIETIIDGCGLPISYCKKALQSNISEKRSDDA